MCFVYSPAYGKTEVVSCTGQYGHAICVQNTEDYWAPSIVRNFLINQTQNEYHLTWNSSLGQGFEIIFGNFMEKMKKPIRIRRVVVRHTFFVKSVFRQSFFPQSF